MYGEQICSSDESLKSVTTAEEFVVVSNAMGGKGIEIPVCPTHGVLHMKMLKSIFKDATGLKYRNPDSGLDRVLLMDHDETFFITPIGGWKDKTFTVVRPTKFGRASILVIIPQAYIILARQPGNQKKQTKRALANKFKMMANAEGNTETKARSTPSGAKASAVSVGPENAS
ncbi:unnamed protein product [Thelazia callipaeda]|uniref:TDP43_N domain-containing protein n=1 Tax=Thelazia callipaeda TaxID=103827 RepID=A0A0N5D6Q0_THECL|nr:unnamed protein product [Thelazia callipaeda]